MACSNDDRRDGQQWRALADIERCLLADGRYRRRVRRALRQLPGPPAAQANSRSVAGWLALAACLVLLVLFVVLLVVGVPRRSRAMRGMTVLLNRLAAPRPGAP